MTKWISHKSIRTADDSAYHTDRDCRHVGPNHRPVGDDHGLVQDLPECSECAGESPEEPTIEAECPYCGETVGNLPPHLPCEASP
jgi:hypothetical protein